MKHSPDLIIAFAFSLMPDGAPGSYNERLANNLFRQLEAQRNSGGRFPLLALQWEVADALIDQSPELADELNNQKKLMVVEPPKFTSSEVEEHLLRPRLDSQASKSCQILSDSMDAARGRSNVERLNNLLNEPKFYEKFTSLDLANLERPKLGELFTEYRTVPALTRYPNGLRRYQRKRINRLIIESVVKDQAIMRRGQYLSTTGVVDTVLDYCAAIGHRSERLDIVAHPLHSSRCIEQTRQAVLLRGQSAGLFEETSINPVTERDGLLYGELPDSDFPWDTSGAQVWCRSLSNWKEYEELVEKWSAEDKIRSST